MKNTETEQTVMTDAELDAALAQMAEEAPPMPADFHDRWMNAVRAEAQNAVPAEEPAPDRKMAAIVHWTRILSVAAVFVFLIGGTLLYRNTKKTLSVPNAAGKYEAAETAVSAAGPALEEAAEEAVPEDAEAAEEDMAEGPVAEEPATAETALREESVQEAAKAAGTGNADKGYDLKAAANVQNAMTFSAPDESVNAEAEIVAEAETVAEAADYDEAPVFEAEEEAPAAMMPTPELTAAPTKVPVSTEAPVPTEAHESGQAGFLQAAGAFFTDMGDFLLAALPYLAVLAVPAVIALAIRRKKARGH